MGKTQTFEFPYTCNMPEHLGGEDADVMLLVEGQYDAGCRGARERSSGVQLEPDEPETIEIWKVLATSEVMYGNSVQTIDVTKWYDELDMRGQEAVIELCLEDLHHLDERY